MMCVHQSRDDIEEIGFYSHAPALQTSKVVDTDKDQDCRIEFITKSLSKINIQTQ